jgi:hypothetical protein
VLNVIYDMPFDIYHAHRLIYGHHDHLFFFFGEKEEKK